jgi:hypothetical protein
MYLHVDHNKLGNDLHLLLSGFLKSREGVERHADLSAKLLDPKCSAKKSARFAIAASCAECVASVANTLHVVWQNGSPIQFSLEDGTCPYCQKTSGFHFGSLDGMHA